MNELIDINNDENMSFFAHAFEVAPVKPIELLKQANVNDVSETSPADIFADPVDKKFPIHTPDHAAVSAVYLYKQASQADDDTLQRTADALHEFGLDDLIPLLDGEIEMVKTAAEHDFLLPSKMKFPVVDEVSLEKTASVVKQHLNVMPVEDRVEIATNLVKVASEFGKNVEELPTWALVYGQEMASDLRKVASELAMRYAATEHPGYQEIGRELQKRASVAGPVVQNQALNRGIALQIHLLDKEAGLSERDFNDAFVTVFNSTPKPKEPTANPDLSKLAGYDIMNIGGFDFDTKELEEYLGTPEAMNAIGEDLYKQASADQEITGENVLAEILDLPEEAQEALGMIFNQELNNG